MGKQTIQKKISRQILDQKKFKPVGFSKMKVMDRTHL